MINIYLYSDQFIQWPLGYVHWNSNKTISICLLNTFSYYLKLWLILVEICPCSVNSIRINQIGNSLPTMTALHPKRQMWKIRSSAKDTSAEQTLHLGPAKADAGDMMTRSSYRFVRNAMAWIRHLWELVTRCMCVCLLGVCVVEGYFSGSEMRHSSIMWNAVKSRKKKTVQLSHRSKTFVGQTPIRLGFIIKTSSSKQVAAAWSGLNISRSPRSAVSDVLVLDDISAAKQGADTDRSIGLGAGNPMSTYTAPKSEWEREDKKID